MRTNRFYKILTVLIIFSAVLQCGPSEEDQKLIDRSKALFGTIPGKMPGSENDTKAIIKLGEKLYFDKRLSANDNQSCNSCHRVDGNFAGVDNLPVSPGSPEGLFGNRNAPTVLNAGFHIAQFWDGRAADLVEQAKGPVLNPVEMAMPSESEVVKKLSAIEEYKELFAKAYPEADEKITYQNIAEAIAAFERTLITSDRFDDFQNGDGDALTAAEKEGLQLFMDKGCIQCHTGPVIGGKSYQKMGRENAYKNQADKGRFEVTGKPEDMFMFKVPSLRNVALTAPYFHDGSVESLEEAVRQMGYLQLNIELTDEEVSKMTAFLKALNGKNLKAIENPDSPPEEVAP